MYDVSALSGQSNTFVVMSGKGHYGFSYMQAAVMARQSADRASTSARDELQTYLGASLEQVDDVVAWWGVCTYPIPLLSTTDMSIL
jgi:hypothetical protein